jgi:hypothetical protein
VIQIPQPDCFENRTTTGRPGSPMWQLALLGLHGYIRHENNYKDRAPTWILQLDVPDMRRAVLRKIQHSTLHQPPRRPVHASAPHHHLALRGHLCVPLCRHFSARMTNNYGVSLHLPFGYLTIKLTIEPGMEEAAPTQTAPVIWMDGCGRPIENGRTQTSTSDSATLRPEDVT